MNWLLLLIILIIVVALVIAWRRRCQSCVTEDFMREHGLLDRILLIYDECAERVPNEPALCPTIKEAATMVRQYIEEYHEPNEERFLFPLSRNRELVAELTHQHRVSRELTDEIIRRCEEPRDLVRLAEVMRQFTRMYRAHESREDTEIFYEVRNRITPEIAELFEEREAAVEGPGGYAGLVERVRAIERRLGVARLAHYEPRR